MARTFPITVFESILFILVFYCVICLVQHSFFDSPLVIYFTKTSGITPPDLIGWVFFWLFVSVWILFDKIVSYLILRNEKGDLRIE